MSKTPKEPTVYLTVRVPEKVAAAIDKFGEDNWTVGRAATLRLMIKMALQGQK